MIWATVRSPSCFCWLYRASPSLAAKNIINLIIGVDHLVMSTCRVFSCCWKRVFAKTSAFSWQSSISLCPASFCTPRPNLPITPGVSWLPTFAFQSPIMKSSSFWGVSSRRFVGLHRTIQLQLLQPIVKRREIRLHLFLKGLSKVWGT